MPSTKPWLMNTLRCNTKPDRTKNSWSLRKVSVTSPCRERDKDTKDERPTGRVAERERARERESPGSVLIQSHLTHTETWTHLRVLFMLIHRDEQLVFLPPLSTKTIQRQDGIEAYWIRSDSIKTTTKVGVWWRRGVVWHHGRCFLH